MLSRNDFIRISLEVNLFYQRIMKEHMFFIETSLTPVESSNMKEADLLKRSMEELLSETVTLANGPISKSVINSNEIVTPYTLDAEQITSKLTGASLNTDITKSELNLVSNPDFDYSEQLELKVDNLNHRSLNLLEEIIEYKEKILALDNECEIFIVMYPTMIEHILREAKLYLEILKCLQHKELFKKNLCGELNFWNDIMHEHAEFIDGMLDPKEVKLKESAWDFARLFERLVKDCLKSSHRDIINRSLRATESIAEFKMEATEGLLECEIKSIIPPLLADHVYREANHYIRLLKLMK